MPVVDDDVLDARRRARVRLAVTVPLPTSVSPCFDRLFGHRAVALGVRGVGLLLEFLEAELVVLLHLADLFLQLQDLEVQLLHRAVQRADLLFKRHDARVALRLRELDGRSVAERSKTPGRPIEGRRNAVRVRARGLRSGVARLATGAVRDRSITARCRSGSFEDASGSRGSQEIEWRGAESRRTMPLSAAADFGQILFGGCLKAKRRPEDRRSPNGCRHRA